MLIDGHRLAGTNLMFVNDLQGGLDHLELAIAMFAGRPGAQIQPAGWKRSQGRLFHDRRVHPVAPGPPGSRRRTCERRDSRWRSSWTIRHHRLRPLPLRPAPPLAAGVRHRSRPCREPARDRRETRLPGLDGGRNLSPRRRPGRARPRRGRPREHPHRDGSLPGAAVAADLLDDAALARRSCQPSSGTASGRPPPDRHGDRDDEPGGGTTLLPEFQILKGDLLLALRRTATRPSEAEHWYRLGFDRARDLNARMSQLRAATRLCREARAISGGKSRRGRCARSMPRSPKVLGSPTFSMPGAPRRGRSEVLKRSRHPASRTCEERRNAGSAARSAPLKSCRSNRGECDGGPDALDIRAPAADKVKSLLLGIPAAGTDGVWSPRKHPICRCRTGSGGGDGWGVVLSGP